MPEGQSAQIARVNRAIRRRIVEDEDRALNAIVRMAMDSDAMEQLMRPHLDRGYAMAPVCRAPEFCRPDWDDVIRQLNCSFLHQTGNRYGLMQKDGWIAVALAGVSSQYDLQHKPAQYKLAEWNEVASVRRELDCYRRDAIDCALRRRVPCANLRAGIVDRAVPVS